MRVAKQSKTIILRMTSVILLCLTLLATCLAKPTKQETTISSTKCLLNGRYDTMWRLRQGLECVKSSSRWPIVFRRIAFARPGASLFSGIALSSVITTVIASVVVAVCLLPSVLMRISFMIVPFSTVATRIAMILLVWVVLFFKPLRTRHSWSSTWDN